MSSASQPVPRIFVSHSRADNGYCRELVQALRASGCEVWYEERALGWGSLRQVIEPELQASDHFIALLSPSAEISQWVNHQINAALNLVYEGQMTTFQLVTAVPCEVPVTLEGKRIERPDGTGYPPAEAAARALAVITSAPSTSPPLPPPAPGLAPTPHGARPSALRRTPRALYDLGFRGWTVNGVECVLPPVCPVPAGVFMMGGDEARDPYADERETPPALTEVGDFWIGQHPVTVAEYACAVRAQAVGEPQEHERTARDQRGVTWLTQLGRLDHPVVCISWNEALAYVRWLAQTTGQRWRLPSEAEWEKAARGTDGRIYPWGNAFDPARCNSAVWRTGTTTPVGRYPDGASPYGAQDMAGNVWEWTGSVYLSYPYRGDDGREDPNLTMNRVLRGGTWGDALLHTRAAYRSYDRPGVFSCNIGFRIALAADDAP